MTGVTDPANAALLIYTYCTMMFSVLTEGCSMLHTFLLGWLVTVVSGLAAYPIDTLKRRMMMTAGQQVWPR